jgi:branched-chain amino acid transport system substrate-binding protein
MKYVKSLLVVLVISLFLIAGCAQTNKDEYQIGVVTSLSGPGANLGKPMVEGMELAVKEINAEGGINGKKVKMFVEDGKMDGQATATGTRFILDINNPDAFVTLFHVDAQVMSPITKEAGIPLVHASFARSILPTNPLAFKINFDSLEGCKQLVQYAKDNGEYKKLGVLMSRVDYNTFCLEGAKQVESDIEEYWYNFGDTDFRTLILKAKEDGVDALLTVGIDFEYVEMFDQLRELESGITLFCATSSECIFPELEKTQGDSLEGTLSIDFVHPEEIAKSEFADKYSKEYAEASGIVVTYAATGYDSVIMLKDILSQCEPGEKDCIKTGLESYKNEKKNTVVDSTGFEDRILRLEYDIYEYQKGDWVQLS